MCHGARLPGQAIPTAVQMRNYIIDILLFDHQCSWLAAPQWAVIWYNNQPKVGAPCVLQTHTPLPTAVRLLGNRTLYIPSRRNLLLLLLKL